MSLAQPQAMQSIVNMDFLRSGAEFSPPTARKAMKAMPQPRKSRNARLEEFYNATRAVHEVHEVKSATDIEAAASMDAWDGLSSHNAPSTAPSIVNLDFLRSGHEFNSDGNPMGREGVTGSTPSPRTSKNSRLESFYSATLKAFEGGAESADNDDTGHHLDCWDGMPCARVSGQHMDIDTPSTADSVVNMDFLRSGAEFKATPSDGMHVDVPAAGEWTPRTRNSRLDDFYARTLAAHQ